MNYKLIRDKIPDIIKKSGGEAEVIRTRDPEAYREMLMLKLNEEVSELHEAVDRGTTKDIAGELADVYEVLQAIRDMTHAPDIIDTAARKFHDRGGFTQGYLLKTK